MINGNVLSERKVTLGSALGDGADYGVEREIMSGLGAGELVVLRPETDLREGTKVSMDF